jgi:hypothetical protein
MGIRDGWKPRHVIALASIVAGVVVFGPVAVEAATGQLVNIADGTNSAQLAKVDTAGRLQTLVAGTVSSHEASPTNFFSANTSVYGSCTTIYVPPSGKSAVILNVQGNAWQVPNTAGTVLRFWVSPTSSPCTGGPKMYMTAADKLATFSTDITAGWGIPAGYALYADEYIVSGSQYDSWIASAQGFTAGSAYVPVPAAAAAPPASAPSPEAKADPTSG